MKQESTIVRLNSIDAYNKLYGLETKHPLVSVIDLTQATKVVNHVRMDYDVYALFLKNGTNCILKYGGSVFCGHVNDAGFWMIKEYFGLSLKETLLSWTTLTSVLALAGLGAVYTISLFI